MHGDPQRPTVVTYFVAIQRFRPANISLGPLPRKPAGWLPDNLAGEREPIPTPVTWSTGGTDRDEREWLSDMGDRELCHLLGFLNLKGLAAMAATSRRMRRLVDTDSVWQTVCERLWGASRLTLPINAGCLQRCAALRSRRRDVRFDALTGTVRN